MLTKDLIKYSLRKDRVIPLAIKRGDREIEELAEQVLGAFAEGKGCTEDELRQSLEPWPTGQKGIILSGLFKLQNDKAEYQEPDPGLKTWRWDLMRRAQDLREEQSVESVHDFHDILAHEYGLGHRQMMERLYADLPKYRKMIGVKLFTKEALLHRFNCAQIQFLLLNAKEMKLDVRGCPEEEVRTLLRQVKFHRLLCQVEAPQQLVLSGPMQVLVNAQMYGDRLANFFPHLLNLSKFKMEAVVKLDRKVATLKVDHKCGIESPYKKQYSYIPEEFEILKTQLQKEHPDISLQSEGELLNLGDGLVVIPDLTVHKGERKVHVELIHRWHHGVLKKILASFAKDKEHDLFLGVSRDIAKKKEYQPLLEASEWFANKGFVFTDFPTAKHLAGVLRHYEN